MAPTESPLYGRSPKVISSNIMIPVAHTCTTHTQSKHTQATGHNGQRCTCMSAGGVVVHRDAGGDGAGGQCRGPLVRLSRLGGMSVTSEAGENIGGHATCHQGKQGWEVCAVTSEAAENIAPSRCKSAENNSGAM